jgi:hypothetical protein
VLSDPFSAVPRALGLFFMFCVPRPIFYSTKGVGSSFQVLRSRTRFQRKRGRRVQFSCLAHPEMFSTISRASSLVFMFCAPGLIFSGTDGVRSSFLVLSSHTRFQWYRGHRVKFSCFAVSDSYSAVQRAPGLVLMFSAPGPVFDGTEGVRSNFYVFHTRSRFQ